MISNIRRIPLNRNRNDGVYERLVALNQGEDLPEMFDHIYEIANGIAQPWSIQFTMGELCIMLAFSCLLQEIVDESDESPLGSFFDSPEPKQGESEDEQNGEKIEPAVNLPTDDSEATQGKKQKIKV